MRTTIVLIALSLALPLAAQRRRATIQPVPFPGCTAVTGTPGVAFTRDEGRTLTPIPQHPGAGYTYGLAVLDVPGTMLSWHLSTLSISNDYGCSWRAVGDWQTDFPPSITPAKGGRAFAWSDNREFLLRYDSRGPIELRPPGAIVGLGTDPANGDHLRAGDANGALWESTDAGDTWTQISHLPQIAQSLVYRFAFDPVNPDHIIAGTAVTGAFVTFDGHIWERTSLADNFNVMSLVISPADHNVVWAMAVDTKSGVHAMHRSVDGGRSFILVVAESADVEMQNGPVMAAHPTDVNVLYYTHGVTFPEPMADLYRVEASGTVTRTRNALAGFNAIVFSPVDPSLMYLGVQTIN